MTEVHQRQLRPSSLKPDTPAASRLPMSHLDSLVASVILILGSPRSGTTWLAKIIDSHPDILYRHEPDELGQPAEWMGAAEQIGAWLRQRGLRAAAKRPFFAKSWRPKPLGLIHKGLAVAMAAAQRLPMTASIAGRLGLPDLVPFHRRGSMRAAVKLVNWDGSGAVATLPNCRCCFILRHPCGQVASVLDGWAGKRFAPHLDRYDTPVDLTAAAAYAGSRGVTNMTFEGLGNAAKLAWSWLAFNEPAVKGLDGRPNACVVIYEDLCRRPEAVARELFNFVGLDWQRQTAAFLSASTRAEGSTGFYDVFRTTELVSERWRQSMSKQDQDAVQAVVGASSLARFWPDLAGGASQERVDTQVRF